MAPLCSPSRRIWIQIQDSANNKDILVILKRSALDCHRRRNNHYSNDGSGRMLRLFLQHELWQTWWMRIAILKGDLIVSSASLPSYVLVQGSPNLQFFALFVNVLSFVPPLPSRPGPSPFPLLNAVVSIPSCGISSLGGDCASSDCPHGFVSFQARRGFPGNYGEAGEDLFGCAPWGRFAFLWFFPGARALAAGT